MPTDCDQDITDHLEWARELRGLTPATLRCRRWTLNRLAVCIDRPLREAQTGNILFWEQTVVSGLAAQSRRAYCGHTRAFYKWMVATGRINSDPTLMLTRPKVSKPLPRPISEPDLSRALAAASPKMAAMMTLMADAGLRCLEVAGLSWSDISVADGQTWICVRDGKGQKDRVVPIGETVLRALRRHGTKTRGSVFLGRDGKQITANSVSQTVNEHLHRLGITSTAHKLRARYATQAAEVLDTPLVAQLCGWESLETARHYVKPDRERSAKLVAALDALSLPPDR
jgi:site-specific recombinase XerD